MQSSFQEFLDNQANVYKKFDDARPAVLEKGLTPDPFITNGGAGFFLAFNPPPRLNEPLDRFKTLIEQEGGLSENVVMYTRRQRHITVADFLLPAPKTNGELPTTDNDVVMKLRQLLAILRPLFGEPHCEDAIDSYPSAAYSTDVSFNATTLILKGTPNESFVEARNRVFDAGKELGIPTPPFRQSWGAHITLGRLKKPCGPDAAKTLADLCEDANLFINPFSLGRLWLGRHVGHPDVGVKIDGLA